MIATVGILGVAIALGISYTVAHSAAVRSRRRRLLSRKIVETISSTQEASDAHECTNRVLDAIGKALGVPSSVLSMEDDFVRTYRLRCAVLFLDESMDSVLTELRSQLEAGENRLPLGTSEQPRAFAIGLIHGASSRS